MRVRKMADVFSVDVWKNWEKTGKNEFIKSCAHLIKNDKQSPVFDKNGKITSIFAYINELIGNGIKGVLKREQVVSALQELVSIHHDICAIVLDILSIADVETTESQNDESRERLNFCYIVKECDKFLSDKLLKERLEMDTLQEVGILKNRNFYTKFIKVKTKLYYKQRKFNLFREESEGFAKLVTELNQEFASHVTHQNLLDVVQSLIGCFNLDPNRVLDIILESFESKPKDSRLFIPLIRSYMNDVKTICEVLGSKFTLQKNRTEDAVIPNSLYVLTANLLQHSIIDLDNIYIWFTPDDKAMQKDWDKEMKDAKEYVRKLGIISINNKEKEDAPEERENPMEKYNTNQKLKLLEALFVVGDWETAKMFINRMPEHYAIGFEPIATAMCKLLHIIIEPVYRAKWSMGNVKGKPINPHESQLAPKQATTFLELRDLAFPMLTVLGPSLHFDPILLHKIIRLSKLALAEEGAHPMKMPDRTKDTLYHDIITLMDVSILPSLSYLDCNCSIAEEIWSLLKIYPYQTRYCLYSRWKNETYTIYPELLRKRGDAEKSIKNIMKRVSKENIKPAGRIIGKLTHSSPGFLFDYVLVQIQVYDNLILPVVDSLKYLTNLSYDVLGFCLIESLANADKKRVKHDSTSISGWLQSLSSFCGAVFKKYNIELSGLLQYVANQLKAQKSLDLLILKEIVQKMAGIETSDELTNEQLNAMSGGELLKTEAGYFSQVRNTKKSSQRLKEAMADENLAVTLCLLIAQQKYCIVYKETQQGHLKLVGKLFDQCQDTLVQFGSFLGTTLSVDEYIKKLPSIQSMLLEYHIPNEVAFFLARPMFNHTINIKYDQLRKADPNYKKMTTAVKQQKYYDAVIEVMSPVHKSLIPLHPAKVWDDVTPQFLTTFWSLTMYDLYVPEETYAQTVNKIKAQALSVTDANSSKGKKEVERYHTLIEKLQEEKRKQHDHVEKVMYRLRQEKDSWFVAESPKNDTITRFLQLCIFPRCTFTAVDAVYCAKFLHTIHILKTSEFSTVLCYDRLFCDVTYSITSCTENEAMRYGRFLNAMLETLMRWHRSKDVFEKECANYPGFVTKFRACNQFTDNTDKVCYENYRHVCHKWHYKLTKALIICLESKDYVQIRNALIVLIKIIPHFPVLIKLSQIIEKKIERLAEVEKNTRQDLFILAISYVGQLKNKIASGNVMHESDFHLFTDKEKAKSTDTKSDSSKHNGDAKATETKEKSEKKEKRQSSEESRKSQNAQEHQVKEKSNERDKASKDEPREKHMRKEEKREEPERERDRDREKRRERKEEKTVAKEERPYRDERYVEMVSPKDESRYSNERGPSDRYYDERTTTHYYREVRDEREISVNNGNNSGSSKHNQETSDPDRDVKRRKMEGPSSKMFLQVKEQVIDNRTIRRVNLDLSRNASTYKHDERKVQLQVQQQQQQLQQPPEYTEKVERKERSAKAKDKRDKMSDEEKELRKERKLGRKRDRAEEAASQAEKRKREEEKAKLMHQNGELMEVPHGREKYHHTRESPYNVRERERSHDRVELREKHRRSTEGKRR